MLDHQMQGIKAQGQRINCFIDFLESFMTTFEKRSSYKYSFTEFF